MTEEEFLDKRPDPRPRKLNRLWQYFILHNELLETGKRHKNRIIAAERGKTNCFDADVERQFMKDINLEENLRRVEKQMIEAGQQAGDIWEWLTSIRGLRSGSLAARLLAHIDDVGKFDLVSQLWRFCGLAVFDGRAEAGTKHFNRRLKALLLGPTGVAGQFVLQNTPVYRDIFDDEKARLYGLYPDPQCNVCDKIASKKGLTWVCPDKCIPKQWYKIRHTPLHIDKMARRKTVKIFIQHLWILWREQEGLPLSEPWIFKEGSGHTHYIPPQPKVG